MLRIWPSDAFRMSARHLDDWLAYMAFAGVSEVRVYDHCLHPSECLGLKAYYAGLVVHYIPWHSHATYSAAQLKAYDDSIGQARLYHGDRTLWLMHLDVDEYPFSPLDTRPGFLVRFIAHLPPNVSQVVMRSLFFGGPPDLVTAADRPLPLQFVHRHTEAEAPSQRTKYMARVGAIVPHGQDNLVHRLRVNEADLVPEPDALRVNHYWGFRLGKPFASLILDRTLHDLFPSVLQRLH